MAKDSEKGKVREATVSGIFYPELPEELSADLDALFAAAAPADAGVPTSVVKAILSPHAGLGYSGDLAAQAWLSVAPRDIERVVVLSPFHRAEEEGIFLTEAECFATPLGPVHVDAEANRELLDCGTAFSFNDIPHFEEHGIEMQLPFMRKLYPEARLVPILVSKAGTAMVKSLASALALVFREVEATTLFVVSTDLSAGHDAAAIAAESDALISLMAERNWQAILDLKARDDTAACGSSCIAAWLACQLSAGCTPHVLARHDSAKIRQSEDERLVQYAALAFEAPAGNGAA